MKHLKILSALLFLVTSSFGFKYQWGYLSLGSYLDWFENSTPIEWESRNGRPFPPQRPAPQTLTSLKGAAFFEWTPKLSIGYETDVFYNATGPYETFYQGKFQEIEESAWGWGDSKIKLIYNLIPNQLYLGWTGIIPGIYPRSGIDFSDGTRSRPWTGMGAFRTGIETLYKSGNHSVYNEFLFVLPSTDRATATPKSFEGSLGYHYKRNVSKNFTSGAGLNLQYKNYEWRFPDRERRIDFAVAPDLSIGWINEQGNREVSLSVGFTAFSYTKDNFVNKPPGAVFLSIYTGFY